MPFVGRRIEIDRLLQHRERLEGNRERGRHVVLVEGFSGVGKTAVVEEFLAMLDRDDRSFTLRGAYNPHLRRPALAPFCDALDELLAARFARRRILSLFADTTYFPLVERLPILASTIGHAPRSAGASTPNPGAQAALIASVLAHAARFRPVIALLDDVQWMPDEDVQALAALNSGLRNAPVLVIATMRREAPEAERIREMVRPMLHDHFYVQPLPGQEMAELLTELYGARISAQLTSDIVSASEGFPQRAMELVQLLEAQGVLAPDVKGQWQLSRGYHPRLLARDRTSADRLRDLAPDERLLIMLMGSVGGQARRDELAEWVAYTLGEDQPHDIAPTIDRLEAARLIKPMFSNPDELVFAHDSVMEAQRQLRTQEDLASVVQLVVGHAELRGAAYRWTYDPEVFGALMDALPPIGTPERSQMVDPMIGSVSIYETWDRERRIRICEAFLANSHRLSSREYAHTLAQTISWYHLFTRFAEAIPYAEQLYQLTLGDPSCSDIHAESCVLLAAARSYHDRSVDVSALLQEAWQALGRIDDPHTRLVTELRITRVRAALVPVSKPQEALKQMRRVLQLAGQLGIDEEKYNVIPDLVVRCARLRDEENLRFFCNELLQVIRDASGGKPLPPFITVVSSVVRATLIAGDVFMARTIFESWSRCSAPLEITDFVAYSMLTALFALVDGEPSVAADAAINAREEILRYRAASKDFSWELAFNYAMLQVQVVPALVAAGRLVEALGLTETMLLEMQYAENVLPDVMFVHQLYRTWLRWRCLLPLEAPISLSWPTGAHGADGGHNTPAVTFDPMSASRAGVEYRTLYSDSVETASAPLRFIAEILLATLECAERHYPEALAAVERAAAACEQLYDWQKEVEYRAAGIMVRLRWAQADPELADRLAEEALEGARSLFGAMQEKGMVARIGQLASQFREEAHAISGASYRDLPATFERIGATAQAAAHAVVRNSRSQESGPIDRARLFLMGPLRLMRQHSYMELGDSVFGREAARNLLTALVAAMVLDRAPTREELAAQVAPKARTMEQQKKALYNAASAARAACGSANSILAVGATSLELNANAEMEGSVWVDALEIVHAVKRGRQHDRDGKTGTAFKEYQRALEFARKGDFAADTYADWVDAARDRLRELVREAALAVARIALRSGLYQAGIEAVGGQLTRNPFDEEAHRFLIRLYNESGDRSAALTQLDKCRKMIKREFGAELEPETLRLRQEILAAEGEETFAAVRI